MGDPVRFASQETAPVDPVRRRDPCTGSPGPPPTCHRRSRRCLFHRLHADRLHTDCDGGHFPSEFLVRPREEPVRYPCISLPRLHARWGFGLFAVLPFLAIGSIIALPREQGTSPLARRTSVRELAKSGLGPLSLAAILRQAGVVGAQSLILVYMASLGIAEGSMGIARAANHALQVPTMLLLGQLTDRVGRKGIFVLGLGLSALVPLVFGVADSAWGMAAGFLILGIAFSALYVGSTAHISAIVSPRKDKGRCLDFTNPVAASEGC